MRIDAASMLAEMLKNKLPDWNFEVVATDKGNANIAATSKDLQSSFMIVSMPPTRGNHDKVRLEGIARAIASVNPTLHTNGDNVYGRNDDYSFDATVQDKRVSIHIYCDTITAQRIARLIGGGK